MNKEKIFKGQWFLPNQKETQIAGTFYYNRDEGCYIEVVGAFEGFIPNTKRHDIILGQTLNDGKITLADCIRTSFKSNTQGVIVSRYFATFAFIGFHFEILSNIRFDKLMASIADFDKWVGIYGFKKPQ